MKIIKLHDSNKNGRVWYVDAEKIQYFGDMDEFTNVCFAGDEYCYISVIEKPEEIIDLINKVKA
ncbi:MAG: hypothetical protein K6F23_03500 [Solobacterium sp.]|nr:hypothetical protein [Solobacterium sp.]